MRRTAVQFQRGTLEGADSLLQRGPGVSLHTAALRQCSQTDLAQTVVVGDCSRKPRLEQPQLRCHVSQIDPASPYLHESFELADNPWFWQETFILAQYLSDTAPDKSSDYKENDLFAGLR